MKKETTVSPQYSNYDPSKILLISEMQTVISKVQELLEIKNIPDALHILEAYIDSLGVSHIYAEAWHQFTQTKGFFFFELMERNLYEIKHGLKDVPATVPLQVVQLYFLYGNLLFETKQYLKCRSVLERVLAYCPAHTDIWFEYAETFKATGDIDKIMEITKKIFEMSFKRKDVARCHRNFGYCLIEKGEYLAAKGYYTMSLSMHKSDNALRELAYINSKLNDNDGLITPDILKIYAKKYDLPLFYDINVFQLAKAELEHYKSINDQEKAIYYGNILNELSPKYDG